MADFFGRISLSLYTRWLIVFFSNCCSWIHNTKPDMLTWKKKRLAFKSFRRVKSAAFAVFLLFLPFPALGIFLLSPVYSLLIYLYVHTQTSRKSLDQLIYRLKWLLCTPGATAYNRNKQQRICQQTFLSRPKCQWLKQCWLYGRNISSRSLIIRIVACIAFCCASNTHLDGRWLQLSEWVEWNHWVLPTVPRVKQLNFL